MKQHTSIIYFITVLLCLFASGSCTLDNELEPGGIYGIIVDAETAEPMRAIGVELYNKGNSLLEKTVTFDDGSYQFNDLKPGQYTLRVVANGYQELRYPVSVECGKIARADMQLTLLDTKMTVTTSAVSNITGNGARFNGRCVYWMGYPAHQYGFIYSRSPIPRLDGEKVGYTSCSGAMSYWSFSADVEGLEKGKYYVQAYAINELGIAYGESMPFTIP